MDAKELRRLLEERTKASYRGLFSDLEDAKLKKPGRDQPFHSWWWREYLKPEERETILVRGNKYISEDMVYLSDEDLLLLWAVYCM